MKLLIVKIDHYPNFDMDSKSNGFNELIDRANDEICSSLTHMAHWKFCDKMYNKRYLTPSFLKELTEKGFLFYI